MAHSSRRLPALILACIAALCSAARLGAEPEPPRIEVREGAGPGYASLLVESEPGGALVRLDGLAYGRTPLLLERVAPGPHVLELSLAGRRDRELVIVAAELTAIEVELALEALSAWVEIVVEPEDAVLEFDGDGRPRGSGLIELPVGRHELEIRRFGYQSARSAIMVAEGELTRHRASLAPSPFALSQLRASKPAFNPGNAGALGSVELSFRVSSFGQARLEIQDAAGAIVFSQRVESFDRERQALVWLGRSADGPLPDGEYRARLSVEAEPGIELADPSDDLERLTWIRIDSRLAILPRASGAAGPGLALMAEPFPDPPGAARAELGARLGSSTPAGPALLAGLARSGELLDLALRASLGGDGENWRVEGFGSLPLARAASGWGAALYLGLGAGKGAEASASWLGNAELAGVAGAGSLGLALALGRKTAWLGLAPELGLGFSEGSVSGFASLRGGISLGGAAWRLGVSAEARSRLESRALSMDAPRLAAEAHVFLAPAPLSLSLVGTLDLEGGYCPTNPGLSLLAGLSF